MMSVWFHSAGHFNPLEVPVILDIGGAERSVTVSDISDRGAKLGCAEPPPAGTLVTLIIGIDKLAARVAWSAGRSMGVQFLGPL